MRRFSIILLLVACGGLTCGAEDICPRPDDVKVFVADPIPSSADYFKGFRVTQKDFDVILKDYFQVSEEHWRHNYSHVAFGDRTGHVILKDDRNIRWMVRPGGLAWLEFPSGQRIYLARSRLIGR